MRKREEVKKWGVCGWMGGRGGEKLGEDEKWGDEVSITNGEFIS